MKLLLIYILTGVLIANPVDNFGEQEQDQKARVRMRFEYFKGPAEEYLSIRVMGRLERRYEAVDNIGVSVYLTEQSEDNLLGRVTTGSDGVGLLILSEKYYEKSESLRELNFIAVLDQSEIYEDKRTDLIIRKIKFEISVLENDSLKKAMVYIAEMDSLGNDQPVGKVPIRFYVERPLGLLPIGEDFNMTNEKGVISMVYTLPSAKKRWASLHDTEFPNDLPGDPEGLLNIIVKIEDNDDYGNVELSKKLNWGVPTHIDDKTIRRSLWASGANAPILLLLLVNSLIIATWGILVFIVYKIYKISKI
jgi:hypothetical protein